LQTSLITSIVMGSPGFMEAVKKSAIS